MMSSTRLAAAADEVWVGRQRGGLTRIRSQGETFSVGPLHACRRPRAGQRLRGASRPRRCGVGRHAERLGSAGSKTASSRTTTRQRVSPRTRWRRFSRAPTARCGSARRTGSARFPAAGGAAMRPPTACRRTTSTCSWRTPPAMVWAGTAGRPRRVSCRPGRDAARHSRPSCAGRSSVSPRIGRGWLWISTADRVLRVNRDGLHAAAPRRYRPARIWRRRRPDGARGRQAASHVVTDPAGASGSRCFVASRWSIPHASTSRRCLRWSQIEEVSADGTPIDLYGMRDDSVRPAAHHARRTPV